MRPFIKHLVWSRHNLIHLKSEKYLGTCANAKKPSNLALKQDLINDLISGKVRPKDHPGRLRKPCIQVPDTLLKNMKLLSENEGISINSVLSELKDFQNYLRYRQPPARNSELRVDAKVLYKEFIDNIALDYCNLSTEEKQKIEDDAQNFALKFLKSKYYHWKPLNLSKVDCFKYLLTRMPPEYAILRQIMNEIKERNAKFKPESLFDFGSGVGSAVWAAKETWKSSLKELFLVDSNPIINDISAKLLNDGLNVGNPAVKGIFYRQFLPSSSNIKYDIVVCAYSLLELPDEITRLKMIANLWSKTNNYLIIVDYNSYPIFKIIMEARDFLMQHSDAHVFAPCPHHSVCQRTVRPGNNSCKSSAKFIIPSYLTKENISVSEFYSYIVIQRGRVNSMPKWPRIVEPVIKPKKQVICRLCCSDGQIKEINITKFKHGRELYQCAKYSKLGDFLPVKIE